MPTRGKNVQLKTDRFEIDDDLDIPSFDLDFDDIADNRKPVTKVKDGIVKGIKSSLAKPSTYRNLLRYALPTEYGRAYDTSERIGLSLRQTYKEAADELRPATGDLARSVEDMIPEQMRGARAAMKKLQEWGKTPSGLSSSTTRQREDNLTLELGNIFKTQYELQSRDIAKQEATKKLDDALGVIRHRDQMQALSQMSYDIQRLAQYQVGVTQAYQKKSLELQYRSYFVQADTLELQRKSIAALTSRLDAISKNTALPDFVKTRSTEYVQEQLRNRFLQTGVNSLFGGGGQTALNFVRNLTSGVRDRATSLASIMNLASMGLDTASSMRGMGPDGIESGASGLTGLGMTFMARRAGSALQNQMRRRTPGLFGRLQTGANNLRYFRSAGTGILSDFADQGYDFERGGLYNSIVNPLRNLVDMGLGQRGPVTGFETDSLAGLRNASTFNNQTQKSVTEIIPGLLARILREVTVLRTGDESTGLITYDYQSNKFTTMDSLASDIRGSILNSNNTEHFANNFGRFLSQVGLENLPEAEQREFAKYLLDRLMRGNGFSTSTFTDPTKMFGMSPELANTISSHFSNYYSAGDVSDANRNVEVSRRRAEIAEMAGSFNYMLGDPRSLMQQLINAGHLDTLRQAGLVTESGGRISINTDALLDQAVSGIGGEEFTANTARTGAQRFTAGEAGARGAVISGTSTDLLSELAGINTSTNELIASQNEILSSMLRAQQAQEGATSATSNLKTVEDLLAVIALNTAGAGTTGAQAPMQEFASQRSFALRWPRLFRSARQKVEQSRADGDISMGQAFADLAMNTMQVGTQAAGFAVNAGQAALTGGATLGRRGLRMGQNVLDRTTRALRRHSLTGALSMGNVTRLLSKPLDLFVGEQKTPRLYKLKMQAGKYIDVTTNKIVTKVSDITGDVMDIDTGAIVLMKDEIKDLVYYSNFMAAAQKVGTRLLQLGEAAGSTLLSTASAVLPMGLRTVMATAQRVSNTLTAAVDRPKDIYVKGESKPRLFKYGFINGLYFLKNSGQVVRKPSDIIDEIVDKEGNTLLSADDMERGLLDARRQPINSMTRQAIAAIADRAIGAVRTGANVARTLLTSTRELFGNIARGSWNNIKDFFANFGFGFFGKESLDVLKEIRDLLDERLPGDSGVLGDHDNTGRRDANWQELMGSDEYNSGRRIREFDENGNERRSDRKNIFDAVQEKVTGMIGGLIDGALDILGLGLGGAAIGGAAGGGGSEGGGRRTRGRGRIRGMLGRVGSFGATLGGGLLSALGLQGIVGRTGSAISSGVRAGAGAAGSAFGSARAAMPAGGRFGRLMGGIGRSGIAGAEAMMSAGGRVASGLGRFLPGVLGAGMGAAGGVARGAGLLGRGIGAIGRFGARALPVAGTIYGVSSGLANAAQGNYGAAALDAGIAATSAFGIGGTLSALGTGLGALAGAVFSPIGLGVLGVGAAAYGGYKLFKWITKKDFNELSIYRMYQYGLMDKDNDYHLKVYNLEKMLEPAISISGSTASIDETKIDLKEVLKIFKINSEDEDGVTRLGEWFQKRFKPVYFSWMAAINSLYGQPRIDSVESEARSVEDKVKLLKLVQVDEGVYSQMTLPFPESARSVVSPWLIAQAASSLNKKYASEANQQLGTDGESANALPDVFAAGDTRISRRASLQSQVRDDTQTSQQIATAFREDMLKGTGLAVTVEGDKSGKWLFDKTITAFEAVVLKSYGLKTFKRSLVASLRWLEYEVTQYLNTNANDTVEFRGDAEQVQIDARKYFGISKDDEEDNKNWMAWFVHRFLPVFTTKVTHQQTAVGNNNYRTYRLVFDALSQEALELVKQLVGRSDIWQVSDTPWPGEEINTDPGTCKPHINYVTQNVKDVELIAQVAQDGQARVTAKLASDANARSMQQANAAAAARAQERLQTSGSTTAVSGGSMTPAVYNAPQSPVANVYASYNVDRYVRYTKSGQSLRGMHPEFLKLFMAAAQEYYQETGNTVSVREVTPHENTQALDYTNLRALTQNDGEGMVEYGLGINIDPSVALQMQELGLLTKYGLIIPIEGNPEHIEPQGLQMLINRANNNKAIINRAIARGAPNATDVGTTPKMAALNTSQTPSTGALIRTQDAEGVGQRGARNINRAQSAYNRSSANVDKITATAPQVGGYASSIAGDYVPDFMNTSTSYTGPMGALLAQISQGEGTTDQHAHDNKFNTGYDVVLGYGAYGRPSKPLSTMTVGEVKRFQGQMLRHPDNKWNSSAAGKYQIVRRTLEGLQKQMKFPDSQIFDAAFQDKLAIQLLKGRGLNRFLNGNMPARNFQLQLAEEWASIARPDSGRSHYNQATGTSNSAIQSILASLKDAGPDAMSQIATPTQVAAAIPDDAREDVTEVAEANEMDNDSSASEPAVQTASALSTARGGMQTVSYSPSGSQGLSRAPRDTAAINDAYQIPNRAPAVPSTQPGITEMDRQINESVMHIGSILTQSLEVQKLMLRALENLPEAQARASNGMMQTLASRVSANQTDALKPYAERSSVPMMPAPISVSRRTSV